MTRTKQELLRLIRNGFYNAGHVIQRLGDGRVLIFARN